MWSRVRNLTCKNDTDDYYNPIVLNNIFNDDIFDEWIREGEQPMLPPDNLSWLDESIRRSDESGGDVDDDGDGSGNGGDDGDDNDGSCRGDGGNDEETRGVGGSQRGGAVTWDSEYYATQDTDHGARAGMSQQRRHLDGWSISVLAMIIRVDMITTHIVIIVLKAIYRGWV